MKILLVAVLPLWLPMVLAWEPIRVPVTGTAEPIVNGTAATAGAYPWMSALLRKNSLAASLRKFCGGSLIAPTWVLTAAHCVDGVDAGKMEVLIGRDNLDGNGGELKQVSRIILHPRYHKDHDINDIALVQLQEAANATPVALPAAADTFIGTRSITLGWGSTSGQNKLPCTLQFIGTAPAVANQGDYSCKSYVYRSLSQSAVLRSAPAVALSNAGCNARFLGFLKQYNYRIPSNLSDLIELYPGTLCVIDPAGSASACYGDSGGPYVVQHQGRSVVAGITSFGLELGCQGRYHIEFYTEVADFLDFINSTMTSDPALTFDRLCPAKVSNVAASVEPVANGAAPVHVRWDASANATGYIVLYVPLPRGSAAISRQRIAATRTGFEASVPAGTRYLVAVQALGRVCDAAVSAPVEVAVP